MAGEGSPKPTVNMDDGFDVDPYAYNLPFQSRLFDDALGFAPPNAPDDLTLREKLAWLESPSMLSLLRKWRAEVFDPKEIRAQIEHVCSTDFSNASDMINTLIGLCFAALGGQKTSHNGAFEATACTAATLDKLLRRGKKQAEMMIDLKKLQSHVAGRQTATPIEAKLLFEVARQSLLQFAAKDYERAKQLIIVHPAFQNLYRKAKFAFGQAQAQRQASLRLEASISAGGGQASGSRAES